MAIKLLIHAVMLLAAWAGAKPARANADSLKALLQQPMADSTKARVMVQLARQLAVENTSEARHYAQQAIDLATVVKAPLPLAAAHLAMGLALEYEAVYDTALLHYRQATSVAKRAQDLRTEATGLKNQGIIHFYQSRWDSSTHFYLLALRLYEQLQDAEGQASVLNNLGSVFEYRANYQKALDYYLQALAIKETLPNKTSLANTLNNIGNVYGLQQQNQQALAYYNRALEIRLQTGDKKRAASAYANLGSTYVAMQDYRRAIAHFNKAKEIDEALNNQEGLVYVWMRLGNLYRLTGNSALAQEYASRALTKARALGLRKNELDILKELIETLYDKNPQATIEYFNSYAALRDSLFNEDNNRQLAEMQTLYETEKKEQQIALLTAQKMRERQNRIWFSVVAALFLILAAVLFALYRTKQRSNLLLAQKNEELKILDATRNKLFAIIAHDLRNPLSAFRGLTEALQQNLAQMSTHDLQYYINELSHTSHSLYDLLQNLLSWAMAQTGKLPARPQTLELAGLINQVVQHLHLSMQQKQISLQVQVSPEAKVFADVQMVQTIVRNLLDNAIKFTPPGGSITIASHTHNPQQTGISIIDSGIGIAQEDLTRLFDIKADVQSIGQSPEKGTGLGLVLCQELARKNEGTITVTSKLHAGTAFTLWLPAA
ncbi:MAG TPA: tetratricopeptide repeat-containing sensor histidine kinase [Phnomibacter sp.]|nr:tetratricopeptide repeat-containing sensor histidine kinase [Phnomibacter sp.]